MPEIGSCISLISKADIRYEGFLFTVDPERCTIALARVKSYGTEDRETQFPIAPQNQYYDYILFRGTDIKDIRVINNNPVPNDPAIMQMHLPPQPPQMAMPSKLGQPAYQSQPGFMMPQMGGPQASVPPGGPMPPMGGPPPPGHGQQPQMGGGGAAVPSYNAGFGGMNNLGGGSGSRSGTPSNMLSRKSPTVDIAVQTNQQQQQQSQQQQQQHHQGQQQSQQQQMMQQINRDGGNNNQRNKNNNHRGSHPNNNQRERRDSGKQQQQTPQQIADNQIKENYNNNKARVQQQQQGGAGGQNRGGWNNNRNHQNNHNNGGNNLRGRPRAGNIGQPQQQQQGSTGGAGGQRAKNLLKFDNDYDFEQANSKFEELRSQLSKLKVGEEVKPEQITETLDKKDDSGNETGAGEHEQEEEEVICYDKAKSFFDTISCEAVERAKGKQQRTDWRQERKLNTETFGVGSTRRGGYNRRGGYYNRGPNNYHRGGNNYRGGSNSYRGRSGNRNNQLNGGGMSHNRSGGQQQQQGGTTGQNNQNAGGQQQPNQATPAAPTSQEQQQPAVIEVAAGK